MSSSPHRLLTFISSGPKPVLGIQFGSPGFCLVPRRSQKGFLYLAFVFLLALLMLQHPHAMRDSDLQVLQSQTWTFGVTAAAATAQYLLPG